MELDLSGRLQHNPVVNKPLRDIDYIEDQRLRAIIQLFVLLSIGATLSARVDAQSTARCAKCDHAIGFVVGKSYYDLSDTGTGYLVGLRADKQAGRWLIADAALTLFSVSRGIGYARYWIPEAQLQAQWTRANLRPYAGFGGGWLIGDGSTRGTASGAIGVRYASPKSLISSRFEARLRGIGREFGASATELTLGIARRF